MERKIIDRLPAAVRHSQLTAAAVGDRLVACGLSRVALANGGELTDWVNALRVQLFFALDGSSQQSDRGPKPSAEVHAWSDETLGEFDEVMKQLVLDPAMDEPHPSRRPWPPLAVRRARRAVMTRSPEDLSALLRDYALRRVARYIQEASWLEAFNQIALPAEIATPNRATLRELEEHGASVYQLDAQPEQPDNQATDRLAAVGRFLSTLRKPDWLKLRTICRSHIRALTVLRTKAREVLIGIDPGTSCQSTRAGLAALLEECAEEANHIVLSARLLVASEHEPPGLAEHERIRRVRRLHRHPAGEEAVLRTAAAAEKFYDALISAGLDQREALAHLVALLELKVVSRSFRPVRLSRRQEASEYLQSVLSATAVKNLLGVLERPPTGSTVPTRRELMSYLLHEVDEKTADPNLALEIGAPLFKVWDVKSHDLYRKADLLAEFLKGVVDTHPGYLDRREAFKYVVAVFGSGHLGRVAAVADEVALVGDLVNALAGVGRLPYRRGSVSKRRLKQDADDVAQRRNHALAFIAELLGRVGALKGLFRLQRKRSSGKTDPPHPRMWESGGSYHRNVTARVLEAVHAKYKAYVADEKAGLRARFHPKSILDEPGMTTDYVTFIEDSDLPSGQ